MTWQAKHGDTRVLTDCVGIGKCGTQDMNDNLLRCRLLTPLRNADYIERCPLSGLTRKTFAQTEFF